MPYRVNFDGVDDSGEQTYPVIPVGVYRFQIVDGEETLTKKRAPMLKLRLEVDAGTHVRHVVWDNLVLSGPGLSRAKMLYKQIGLPCEGPQEIGLSDLIGMSVWALVDVDEFEGKKKNVVAFAGFHERNVPAGEDVLKINTAKHTKGPEPRVVEEAEAEDEDGLPF